MRLLEVSVPFARWHISFIGKLELPKTINGNWWIFMAVDWSENWPIARALNSSTANEIVMKFDCPIELFSAVVLNFWVKFWNSSIYIRFDQTTGLPRHFILELI